MKKVIEINGAKLEVDLREAKSIESYKVGDYVKVLKKNYGDSYCIYIGQVVSLDNFAVLPTITIAYLEQGYGEADVKLISLNAKSGEDFSITTAGDSTWLHLERDTVIDCFERKIQAKKLELQQLVDKRDWLLQRFAGLFSPKTE